jgi:hypothetical protein
MKAKGERQTMKRTRTLLAALALIGGATLGLAGCAVAAAGDVTPAARDYAPGWACTESYPDHCGAWGGDDWGGDHWWRLDRFHQVSEVHGFGHADGVAHAGGDRR